MGFAIESLGLCNPHGFKIKSFGLYTGFRINLGPHQIKYGQKYISYGESTTWPRRTKVGVFYLYNFSHPSAPSPEATFSHPYLLVVPALMMKHPEAPVGPMIAIISSAFVSAHLPSLVPELKFSKFTHLYFKRYEPQSPKHVLSILFGIPSFLSLLKAYVAGTPVSALSTSSLLGTFVVYFATLIGSIAVYRTSPFHPLAKYPGPFIAKLSKMWMVDSFPRLLCAIPAVDRYT